MTNSNKNSSTSHIKILLVVFFLFLAIWYIFIENAPYTIYSGSSKLKCIIKDNTLVLITKSGRTLSQEEIDKKFQDGPQRVYKNDKLYGYIDKTGKVIRNQWDDCENFREGMAIIKVGSRYGFINASGEVVVSPYYTSLWPYFNGEASGEYRGTTYILDLQGNVIDSWKTRSGSSTSSSNYSSSSSSEKKNTCGHCGKSYSAGDSGGNYMNIARSGLCNSCYAYYKSASNALGK